MCDQFALSCLLLAFSTLFLPLVFAFCLASFVLSCLFSFTSRASEIEPSLLFRFALSLLGLFRAFSPSLYLGSQCRRFSSAIAQYLTRCTSHKENKRLLPVYGKVFLTVEGESTLPCYRAEQYRWTCPLFVIKRKRAKGRRSPFPCPFAPFPPCPLNPLPQKTACSEAIVDFLSKLNEDSILTLTLIRLCTECS